MKILHTVEFYHPSVGGAQEVVRQVSERLVARGHQVTVATTRLPERDNHLINGVRVQEFRVSGSLIRGLHGDVESYRRFLRDEQFDVMMNYAAQQWATDAVFDVLPAIEAARILAPCGFSALFDPHAAEYFRELPHVLRQYDRLILHSEGYRDGQFVRRHGMAHATCIPNGAAREEFEAGDATGFREQHGIPPHVPFLLTVGTHTGTKGHKETLEAFLKARIGKAVLAIVGNTLEGDDCLDSCRRRARVTEILSLGKKRVLVLQLDRSETVEAFKAADLFVFASNLECAPIVLTEAIAAGTPFIATPCGSAPELAEETGGGIIVPARYRKTGLVHVDSRDLAIAIESLVKDPARLSHMGDMGRRAWMQTLTWDAISARYERVYQAVLSARALATSVASGVTVVTGSGPLGQHGPHTR